MLNILIHKIAIILGVVVPIIRSVPYIPIGWSFSLPIKAMKSNRVDYVLIDFAKGFTHQTRFPFPLVNDNNVRTWLNQ